ncbi:hypothetical protein C8R45DRAFT_1023730 [Mycena sanguinolenta]|nr:hypothetical protein C8R45DRAFT_1023730 [Mycena sanguinolenta]
MGMFSALLSMRPSQALLSYELTPGQGQASSKLRLVSAQSVSNVLSTLPEGSHHAGPGHLDYCGLSSTGSSQCGVALLLSNKDKLNRVECQWLYFVHYH